MSEHRERRCHMTGWWVFVGSAVCFIIAGVRTADLLTIVGGILFLLGCLIFLFPMAYSGEAATGEGDNDACCKCEAQSDLCSPYPPEGRGR